ncbi:hypothetical protein ABW19_dt0205364 [Dactylella cylindrospora]|nr:hypothetical protein ABW19_dt0205364 [Dactylella cylindrospora]
MSIYPSIPHDADLHSPSHSQNTSRSAGAGKNQCISYNMVCCGVGWWMLGVWPWRQKLQTAWPRVLEERRYLKTWSPVRLFLSNDCLIGILGRNRRPARSGTSAYSRTFGLEQSDR